MSAVGKAPVDNKSCLFAGLTKAMAVMKDTLREVRRQGRGGRGGALPGHGGPACSLVSALTAGAERALAV